MQTNLSTQRRVGKTKLTLPQLGFGTAPLGELYEKVSEDQALATLTAAWDQGVRYYDTAAWYGRGLAECRLGVFLNTKNRNDYVVTTKVGRTLTLSENPSLFDTTPWAGGLKNEIHFDYSYDGLMRSYHQARHRLQLDRIDALIIHDLDPPYHGDKIFAQHLHDLEGGGVKALQELKNTGAIQAYGIGINSSNAFKQVVKNISLDFALIAMPYTLLDQTGLHTTMAACLQRDISVIIGAPFASGILATGLKEGAKYDYAAASPEICAKVHALETMCAAHGIALIPTPKMNTDIARDAAGAARLDVRPGEVIQNVQSFETPIPASFWLDLKAQGLIVPDAPVPTGLMPTAAFQNFAPF